MQTKAKRGMKNIEPLIFRHVVGQSEKISTTTPPGRRDAASTPPMLQHYREHRGEPLQLLFAANDKISAVNLQSTF